MYYDDEHGAAGFIAGLLIGVLVGASAALLAASGQVTDARRRLLQAVGRNDWGRHAADDEELAGNVRAAVRAGRRRAGL
jgi:gas vesicle protein